MKQNRQMLTCNRLDLELVGSWLTMYAQKLQGHWSPSSCKQRNVEGAKTNTPPKTLDTYKRLPITNTLLP